MCRGVLKCGDWSGLGDVHACVRVVGMEYSGRGSASLGSVGLGGRGF